MKKALKLVGWLLGLIALVAGGLAVFIALDWPVKHPVKAPELKVEATPERLLRGKLLVSVRCAGCHYNQQTGTLSGQQMMEAPKEFGPIFSHNITQHATKGIGRYTNGELLVLLRTGVRRDGIFTGPFMQSPYLSDEDMSSIIAFLRSNDPWMAATDKDDQDWQPTFLAKLLMHVAFKPMAMPPARVDPPNPSDQLALGRYVAHAVADCFVCHSADFKTLNSTTPEKSGGYFGGGNGTLDASRNVVRSANLTMDAETGIGKWSEEDFVRTTRTGVRSDGRVLRFPMLAFSELSEAEVKAVYAYLKTVPPLSHAVDRSFDVYPEMSPSASEGEKLYNKYACYSCHGKKGVGICDLRQASKKYDTDEKLSAFIHDAGKFVPGTKMPTWSELIPDAQFPSLIAHVHKLEKDGSAEAAALAH